MYRESPRISVSAIDEPAEVTADDRNGDCLPREKISPELISSRRKFDLAVAELRENNDTRSLQTIDRRQTSSDPRIHSKIESLFVYSDRYARHTRHACDVDRGQSA